MAVVLPQLARPHQYERHRGLSRHESGTTSLPVLPRMGDQAEMHNSAALGVLAPLQEVPEEEMVSEHSGGSPQSNLSRPSAKNGHSRSPLAASSRGRVATLSTGQLLLDSELSMEQSQLGEGGESRASSSNAAVREDSRARRRSRARGTVQRSSSETSVRHLGETERQWDRYANMSEANRPVLGRRPLWSHLNTGDTDIERRMRDIDDEGKWLKQRAEARRKFKALPDASGDKRKLVGDPRLRPNADRTTSRKAIEKLKQEDIEKSRQSSRAIRQAMQDCSKSRQQLKSMQSLLRGVESEELQRKQAAAAMLIRRASQAPEAPPDDDDDDDDDEANDLS